MTDMTHTCFFVLFFADFAHFGLFLCLPAEGVLPHSWTVHNKKRWDRGYVGSQIILGSNTTWRTGRKDNAWGGWAVLTVGKVPFASEEKGCNLCGNNLNLYTGAKNITR